MNVADAVGRALAAAGVHANGGELAQRGALFLLLHACAALAIAALLLLLPLRLFEIANPEWRLLAWVHALAVVTLTLLLLCWAGGKAWLRHFAFPVAFIFIAVPWPTALETPVIQGLMRIVARVAAETAMASRDPRLSSPRIGQAPASTSRRG